MTSIQVFDPAMCCSTGICGPEVDPKLVRFAADLDWLKQQGISITRLNLSQEPVTFAQDAEVKSILQFQGEAGLPLIKVNGEVKSSGLYPSRGELAAWAGVQAPEPSLFTDAVAELVAIGAAIASNCEPCFKFHFDKARKLGVSKEDMRQAVAMALRVKESPAKSMVELTDRFLGEPQEVVTIKPLGEKAKSDSSACCSPAKGGAPKKSGCC